MVRDSDRIGIRLEAARHLVSGENAQGSEMGKLVYRQTRIELRRQQFLTRRARQRGERLCQQLHRPAYRNRRVWPSETRKIHFIRLSRLAFLAD